MIVPDVQLGIIPSIDDDTVVRLTLLTPMDVLFTTIVYVKLEPIVAVTNS
jgi:hypothetical protein